ncbi:hypothetical protein Pelo_11056 [Pelomyxa schiedti]|nr:hypothetical protein Pelo_11056 [Pelomyxa schiedti]
MMARSATHLTSRTVVEGIDTSLRCAFSPSFDFELPGKPSCGSSCINRLMQYECPPTCRCGDECINRKFQKRDYLAVMPFRTTKKGWGLMALESAEPGTFVIEYVGEVMDRTRAQARLNAQKSLDKGEFLDAWKKGNAARFINHSCQPNCVLEKWVVLNEIRIGIFTIQQVPAGSELTFDYQLQEFGFQHECFCGTPACRHFLSPRTASTNAVPMFLE